MAAMIPERSRTLHNFSLPPRLNWGTQRLLRCSKLNTDAISASPLPPTSSTDRKRRNPSFRYPPPPPSSLRRRVGEDISSSYNNNNNNKIEAVREKLVLDLCSEVDKFRTAFFKDTEFASPPPPPPIPPKSHPWNLRTATVEVSPSPAEKCVSGGAGDGGRVKFSVQLSRQEIEDDFMQMIGRRPPRKPKRRPRYIQKQLETLFPGLWLSEISADMYKVNEFSEPPK